MFDHADIIAHVRKCISILITEFLERPEWFFTENDLVCRFYEILWRKDTCDPGRLLKSTGERSAGLPLVHMEYPTPFRCDMGGAEKRLKRFLLVDLQKKTGESFPWVYRAEEGIRFKVQEEVTGKEKRGHYDVVILAPEFVSSVDYDTLKAQDYDGFMTRIQEAEPAVETMILYGIEFAFRRDEIHTKGTQSAFAREIIQDAAKLATSSCLRRCHGNSRCMKHWTSLAFCRDEESAHGVCEQMHGLLRNESRETNNWSCLENLYASKEVRRTADMIEEDFLDKIVICTPGTRAE